MWYEELEKTFQEDTEDSPRVSEPLLGVFGAFGGSQVRVGLILQNLIGI